MEVVNSTIPLKGTPMKFFLQRFGGLVLGALCGLDRLVLRGKLRALYAPEGMNIYLAANKVLRRDFDGHVGQVTQQVLQASLIARAKELNRFRYLNSTNIDKDGVARAMADKMSVSAEGLVCVLQCVEPCWSYTLDSVDGLLTVRGKQRKCSSLYHYFIHPQWGWMYARLQTWFPFEMQVYLNGREWLCRQMDQEGLKYRRGDNKILWVEDWQRAQQLLDQQLRTNWPTALDAIQRRVHPLHPGHLGKMPLQYNWTVHQSEWATDVAFASASELARWMSVWQRQAINYDSAEVLRFFGRTGQLRGNAAQKVETEWKRFYEGLRIKHWLGGNSLKLYDYLNVCRVETTINWAEVFKVYRASEADPEGELDWRVMRKSVADLHRRAEVSQKVNERYLEGMAAANDPRSVRELAEPLCARVAEPGKKPQRQVRALNPWSKEDAALLLAISDPKWMVAGIRNRDLAAVLYKEAALDQKEKRRRSARVTRLIRLLRGHRLLQKVPKTHRYQISAEARTAIMALLAAGNANPRDLTTQAA
jgi:hypothetical protein